jgi:hypothetical protein
MEKAPDWNGRRALAGDDDEMYEDVPVGHLHTHEDDVSAQYPPI